ncbi:bifunctional diaminohydroxyphosphoribosylaminopyrimidine deaminase/5-amino-6-(5-phosphoribosylamino)uracil reductase RibD [Ottowia testudinis]|uniref:Riboflavin biosynthesis protein RibD n=1 Tax=Ottowia testudinis TaxID=2816950 RepID=A0A975CEA9_9BURK|nr:bifunctional diaminohydroxyphosphoribosylaminopyrimidine deaminase/5-amino-6-(5-phosphoribosylamino)uracil reductase RibD [Ottowia testudinis]QTD44262.1 bifunctional diaminohydroxyphosphoribosylaminopyrimidine deaminase/5-amino-6-(5-phosphoribosylamino)uracil reductase RibD [Ottowia testudinis]
MDFTHPDTWMRRALALAEQARPISPPNPAVGCVLVSPSGELVGEGHTQAVGQAHAEVMALRDAAARGHATAGTTAYVTLEPCAHQGRTGPCCDALVAAGVTKVVASLQDPNPRVAGQGFARLRAAGVEVVVGPGAAAARELNIGFFSRMVRGVPWVRLKAAASLDGRTALPNGVSQWITSEAARADGQVWRARADVVLTGIGTVLQDDPMMNVRLPDAARQPALVIVDSQLQTPPGARLWGVGGRRVIVYTAVADPARQQALQTLGARVVRCADERGKVDLATMLKDLARHETNEVHVEAGHKLNGSLMRESLVDELLLYQAPKLLGDGAGIAALGSFSTLDQAPEWVWRDIQPIGPDLRLRAVMAGRDHF